MNAIAKHARPNNWPRPPPCSAPSAPNTAASHMPTKTVPINTTVIDDRSRELRRTIVKAIKAGNRGHVGSSFSLVEILRVLYDDVLKYDARNPRWSGRDGFGLSKGPGCLALYALLADKGFFPEAELSKFCKSDGMLG